MTASERARRGSPTPEEALDELLAGNRRFRAGCAGHPRQGAAHRDTLSAGQAPFAALLGCSDSRVPPQLVFDQGLGDLFTVRVAGQVLDEVVVASLVYAVDRLQVPLVLVLGHSGCGAVGATAEALARGEPCDDALGRAICPAVCAAAGEGSERIDDAVRIHVRRTVEQLGRHPAVAPRLRSGTLALVGAVYDLASGEVDLVSGVADPAAPTPQSAATRASIPAIEPGEGASWQTETIGRTKVEGNPRSRRERSA